MSTHAPTAPRRPRVAPAPSARRRPAPAAAWTGTAGGIALLVMVVLCVALVLLSADRASVLSPPSHAGFPSWLSGPLGGLVPGARLSDQTLRWGFTVGMVVMLGCYLVAVRSAAQIERRWAITAVCLLHAVLLLAPPLLLTDAFNYLNYGRMGVIHGLNPYAQIPIIEPHTDPAFGFSNWHHLVSPYGPLFTVFTYALAPLGIAAGFWLLKLSIVAASLTMLLLVWRCAQMLGRPPIHAFLFVGANPVVLVWGLGGDHNDFFLVLALVAAIYLILTATARDAGRAPDGAHRARERWLGLPGDLGAGAMLAAAVAIKASAGIVLPALLLGSPRRRGLLAGLVAGGVALGVMTLVVFGPHTPNLADQRSEVTGLGLPNLIGYFLGRGGVDDTLRVVLDVVLLASVGACALYALRARDWLTAAGFSMLALLLTLSWELPWYVFWLLPFAALSQRRALRVAALALTVYLVLVWVPVINNVTKAIDFHPTTTHLGLQHGHLTQRLLH